MKNLFLFFPQWQGSGITSEIYDGAKLIYKKIKNKFNFAEVNVSLSKKLKIKNNILGYKEISEQLKNCRTIIKKYNPDKIFTIGGDCGVEIAPVSYLNKIYNKNLAVVWLDAHGDLNTPSSSSSKHFHGMPLRILLNSSLSKEQILFLGTRDLDKSETNYLRNKKIPIFNLNTVIKSIKHKKYKNVYIHLDLDVIDPKDFPYVKCPTKNGISLKRLKALIKKLKENFNLAGGSILEFVPSGNKGVKIIRDLANILFE